MQSRRRCCLCWQLDNSFEEVDGQIAHLDKNPSNNAIDNLAYLCLKHHNRYDGKTSVSKNYTIQEVKTYRSYLYDAINAGTLLPSCTITIPDQESQLEEIIASWCHRVAQKTTELEWPVPTLEDYSPGSFKRLRNTSEPKLSIVKEAVDELCSAITLYNRSAGVGALALRHQLREESRIVQRCAKIQSEILQ